jgi:hypothetical protein
MDSAALNPQGRAVPAWTHFVGSSGLHLEIFVAQRTSIGGVFGSEAYKNSLFQSPGSAVGIRTQHHKARSLDP